MSKILDRINSSEDVRKLNIDELYMLSQEIREFLIESVSKTGGHIASNLGVVELTLALHHSFNFPEDKIVFDVGHQSYIHKIITGRKDQMNTLRQLDGLSGFPKREESIYDSFDTGHSSTSVSAAMGIARARDLNKDDYEVIALIGDGALTGGMAFEALNDAGRSHTKMIIILNDNEMSISENVGGLSMHLSKIRIAPGYLYNKKHLDDFLMNTMPGGKTIKKVLRRAKEGVKKLIVPNMLFEELGLTYLGPIDGYDIGEMMEVFEKAKKSDDPVIIHVCTKKGKGYAPAEQRPDEFHGVSSFDIKTGLPLKKSTSLSCSSVFGNKLCDIAKENDKVVAISAAMISGTGLNKFKSAFPNRLFDVGIAEQHAVTMAAGMATNGIVPVVALYSSFLQRAYDQVIHDVATQNLHVVFAIDRAGLVGNDGETHQGVFDESFMTGVPNMTVMAPADNTELENMLDYAINKHNGPISIRYPRGSFSMNIENSNQPIELGKGSLVNEGKDITIVASGKMVETAVKVSELLSEKNISGEVINLRFLKPLDKDIINKSLEKTKRLIIIDEAPKDASIYNKIMSEIEHQKIKVLVKTLPDEFIRHGNTDLLLKRHGLDAQTISEQALGLF